MGTGVQAEWGVTGPQAEAAWWPGQPPASCLHLKTALPRQAPSSHSPHIHRSRPSLRRPLGPAMLSASPPFGSPAPSRLRHQKPQPSASTLLCVPALDTQSPCHPLLLPVCCLDVLPSSLPLPTTLFLPTPHSHLPLLLPRDPLGWAGPQAHDSLHVHF